MHPDLIKFYKEQEPFYFLGRYDNEPSPSKKYVNQISTIDQPCEGEVGGKNILFNSLKKGMGIFESFPEDGGQFGRLTSI